MRTFRILSVAIVGVLLSTGFPFITAAADVQPCLGFVDIPGQGPSCPVEGGWQVLLEDGTSVYTHGPDAAAPEGPLGLMGFTPAIPPACTSAATYNGRVIYARPADKADNYASQVGDIRRAVAQANGLLRLDAAELGRSLSLKVRCDADGQVRVDNVALPTPSGSDSFATISGDLRNLGYTSTSEKYWVFYDDSVACNCAGQGTIYFDDRLILGNWNNAPSGSAAMFAVAYGSRSFATILHEAAHNLGAVQLSAPHTSGAGHCNDGSDIMCYADGGPGSAYRSTVCTARIYFDCNHDDYFHPFPPGGTYLAQKWNVASTLNRFIDFTTGCDFVRIGSLNAGLVGVRWETMTSRTETGIPAGCHNMRYSLTGEWDNVADLDVCWFAGSTLLRCDQNAGAESGIVPPGATAAQVVSYSGIMTRYVLVLG